MDKKEKKEFIDAYLRGEDPMGFLPLIKCMQEMQCACGRVLDGFVEALEKGKAERDEPTGRK